MGTRFIPDPNLPPDGHVYYAHRFTGPNGVSYHHHSTDRAWVNLFGLKRPIVPVRLREWREGDPVPVGYAPDYWGWLETGKNVYSMVWPSKAQFTMCFPYGPKAEADRGRGRIVHLVVEEIPEPALE